MKKHWMLLSVSVLGLLIGYSIFQQPAISFQEVAHADTNPVECSNYQKDAYNGIGDFEQDQVPEVYEECSSYVSDPFFDNDSGNWKYRTCDYAVQYVVYKGEGIYRPICTDHDHVIPSVTPTQTDSTTVTPIPPTSTDTTPPSITTVPTDTSTTIPPTPIDTSAPDTPSPAEVVPITPAPETPYQCIQRLRSLLCLPEPAGEVVPLPHIVPTDASGDDEMSLQSTFGSDSYSVFLDGNVIAGGLVAGKNQTAITFPVSSSLSDGEHSFYVVDERTNVTSDTISVDFSHAAAPVLTSASGPEAPSGVLQTSSVVTGIFSSETYSVFLDGNLVASGLGTENDNTQVAFPIPLSLEGGTHSLYFTGDATGLKSNTLSVSNIFGTNAAPTPLATPTAAPEACAWYDYFWNPSCWFAPGAPAITSIYPAAGHQGDTVTIYGSNFSDVSNPSDWRNTVYFGNTSLGVTANPGGASITLRVPFSDEPGTIQVYLYNNDYGSTPSNPVNFTILSSNAPVPTANPSETDVPTDTAIATPRDTPYESPVATPTDTMSPATPNHCDICNYGSATECGEHPQCHTSVFSQKNALYCGRDKYPTGCPSNVSDPNGFGCFCDDR